MTLHFFRGTGVSQTIYAPGTMKRFGHNTDGFPWRPGIGTPAIVLTDRACCRMLSTTSPGSLARYLKEPPSGAGRAAGATGIPRTDARLLNSIPG